LWVASWGAPQYHNDRGFENRFWLKLPSCNEFSLARFKFSSHVVELTWLGCHTYKHLGNKLTIQCKCRKSAVELATQIDAAKRRVLNTRPSVTFPRKSLIYYVHFTRWPLLSWNYICEACLLFTFEGQYPARVGRGVCRFGWLDACHRFLLHDGHWQKHLEPNAVPSNEIDLAGNGIHLTFDQARKRPRGRPWWSQRVSWFFDNTDSTICSTQQLKGDKRWARNVRCRSYFKRFDSSKHGTCVPWLDAFSDWTNSRGVMVFWFVMLVFVLELWRSFICFSFDCILDLWEKEDRATHYFWQIVAWVTFPFCVHGQGEQRRNTFFANAQVVYSDKVCV